MKAHPVFSVEGKVAIITGSGKGIGKALAMGFSQAGAKIVVNSSRHPEQGRATLAELRDTGGEGIFIQADISSQKDVTRLVEETLRIYRRIDILINNAGVVGGSPAEDLNIDEWNRVLAVNLTGVYLCSAITAKKAMLPQKYGRIVNISSISGEIGHPGGKPGLQQAAYHAAKGGVNTLSRALALEWVSYGITVNTISPGWINTGIDDAFFEADPANLQQVLDDTPMHRLGDPDEIIGTAIYLSSESASFVTGQNIKVDGGYTSW